MQTDYTEKQFLPNTFTFEHQSILLVDRPSIFIDIQFFVSWKSCEKNYKNQSDGNFSLMFKSVTLKLKVTKLDRIYLMCKHAISAQSNQN